MDKIKEILHIPRSNKKLLTLLRNRIQRTQEVKTGMCFEIVYMAFNDEISPAECEKIGQYLDYHKQNHPSGCWFEPNKIEPRINWLNEQIELLAAQSFSWSKIFNY